MDEQFHAGRRLVRKRKGMNENICSKGRVLISSILIICLGACSSAPQVIVDMAEVDKAELEKDKNECLEIAQTYDLDNEAAGKALAGAAIGGAATAGVATAVAGAVFLPALPFILAGSLAGGGLWGSQVSKKEANARQGILEDCMSKRGYEVYSAK